MRPGDYLRSLQAEGGRREACLLASCSARAKTPCQGVSALWWSVVSCCPQDAFRFRTRRIDNGTHWACEWQIFHSTATHRCVLHRNAQRRCVPWTRSQLSIVAYRGAMHGGMHVLPSLPPASAQNRRIGILRSHPISSGRACATAFHLRRGGSMQDESSEPWYVHGPRSTVHRHTRLRHRPRHSAPRPAMHILALGRTASGPYSSPALPDTVYECGCIRPGASLNPVHPEIPSGEPALALHRCLPCSPP